MANTRPRRALGCAPADRIAADKQAMLALPPVAPQTGWRVLTRLARDHYVRLDSNDYSVHPAVIGRRIEVTAELDRVRVFCGGQLVADHERSWAWHQSFSAHPPGGIPQQILDRKSPWFHCRPNRWAVLSMTLRPDPARSIGLVLAVGDAPHGLAQDLAGSGLGQGGDHVDPAERRDRADPVPDQLYQLGGEHARLGADARLEHHEPG